MINSCRVYTPAPLASAMVKALGADTGTWLEPSFGRGSFLREIAAVGVPKEQIVCVDLDKRRSSTDALGQVLRGREFFEWSSHEKRRFDRIIGNPPFLAIERLKQPVRRLSSEVAFGSIAASGQNGNLWCAFLIRCLSLLKQGGHLSFILPAAWAYADYAADLRRKLPTYFREFVVHRSKETLFPRVQDGCIVLQCFGFGEPNRIDSVHHYDSADDLIAGLRPPVRATAPAIQTLVIPPCTDTSRVEDVFRVKLGSVTGDAGFFLLSEKRRRELDLPLRCLVPVLTRAKHVKGSEVTRMEWEELRQNDERAYLFRPSVRCLLNPAVDAYLRLSSADGGCDRLAGWVRKRDPWHQVALPRNVDGFMSGVSSAGPFLTLNRMRGLSATNTLYVISFLKANSSMEYKAAAGLGLLSSYTQSQVRSRTRNYAGGLKKMEPSDIMSLVIPRRTTVAGAVTALREATAMQLQGRFLEAAQFADEWFASA